MTAVNFVPNGQGNGSVTTPGQLVQTSATSYPCRRVYVQAAASNGGLSPTDGDNACVIAVGTQGVSAQLSTRTGVVLYPSQGEWFNIGDAHSLYIDANAAGAKFNYYYEI